MAEGGTDLFKSEMASSAVTRWNREGLRGGYEPLDLVDKSREAMARMPFGKSGIVLGSGPNTEAWKGRGWKTLDIDPKYAPDIKADVNYLENNVTPESQDFLLAEYMKFDIAGQTGSGRGRLLEQANKALKKGGYLIIKSAHFEGKPASPLPDRNAFAESMINHGFNVVSELDEIHHIGGVITEQQVVYYGQKVSAGFDTGRSAEVKII